MLFSSITFLYYFLPISVLGYYLLKDRYRNFFLWIVSLFFYAWGEPVYVLLLLSSAAIDFFAGLFIEKYPEKKKWGLIGSLCTNLSFLCFFKYIPFLQSLLGFIHVQLPFVEVALPLGISFYTFQTMSYSIDVYMGKIKANHNFIDFAMYVALFPQLIAGPIVRYRDVEKQIRHRKHSFAYCEAGITRFVYGLAKKVLLANSIGSVYEALMQEPLSMIGSWFAILAFSFQIYFDFSGYSDMAIGLGKLFGFDFPENFNYPYTAKSITEFWNRWHITLSTWFREYVYIPLGGNRHHAKRNLLIVWTLCGLWHGASLNFVIWGLYYGCLLFLEKYMFKDIHSSLPSFFQHVLTMLLVVFGWVIFAFEDMQQMGQFIASLLSNPVFIHDATVYIMYSNACIFVICILTCIPLIPYINKRIRIPKMMKQLFVCFLFILCTAYLCDATYNPFLYFRF